MPKKIKAILILMSALAVCLPVCADIVCADQSRPVHRIVTSDTILSGMARSLLPAGRYQVEAILPPGQCPGHYDVKCSDIEKMKKADLVISFRGMPYLEKAAPGGSGRLVMDNRGRNWMTPDAYLFGLERLAEELSARFPADGDAILERKKETVRKLHVATQKIRRQARNAGFAGRAVLASSMQKEPLEWMGFAVVGVYGRPESLSVRDIVRLLNLGRKRGVVAVVDNLQSGPDAGKGLAETLARPHVVLSNFPDERGYLSTLQENLNALIRALE